MTEDPVKRAEALMQQQKPIDPASFWLHAADTMQIKAERLSIAAVAASLSHAQALCLDASVATMVNAGVPLRDLEIVYERYSKTEDPYIIHQRCYVRVRAPGRDEG